jgi:hypothetical protein
MTWYEPRQPPVSILGDLRQSDLRKAANETDYSIVSRVLSHAPGEPANRVNAGMTVFGGMTVLSAIFAQSLMIVNFPYECGECVRSKYKTVK